MWLESQNQHWGNGHSDATINDNVVYIGNEKPNNKYVHKFTPKHKPDPFSKQYCPTNQALLADDIVRIRSHVTFQEQIVRFSHNNLRGVVIIWPVLVSSISEPLLPSHYRFSLAVLLSLMECVMSALPCSITKPHLALPIPTQVTFCWLVSLQPHHPNSLHPNSLVHFCCV